MTPTACMPKANTSTPRDYRRMARAAGDVVVAINAGHTTIRRTARASWPPAATRTSCSPPTCSTRTWSTSTSCWIAPKHLPEANHGCCPGYRRTGDVTTNRAMRILHVKSCSVMVAPPVSGCGGAPLNTCAAPAGGTWSARALAAVVGFYNFHQDTTLAAALVRSRRHRQNVRKDSFRSRSRGLRGFDLGAR